MELNKGLNSWDGSPVSVPAAAPVQSRATVPCLNPTGAKSDISLHQGGKHSVDPVGVTARSCIWQKAPSPGSWVVLMHVACFLS